MTADPATHAAPHLTTRSNAHPAAPSAANPLLTIRGLNVVFSTTRGDVPAMRDVNLDLFAGETLAIVGESGSGKSTLAACVNRLLAANGRITSGSIRLGDFDILAADERTMTRIRGSRIGLVPQDPMTNLNPAMKIGVQIAEALEVHGRARGDQAKQRAIALLQQAGIQDARDRFGQYPHEFSGGMRQRVLIAMALACRPQVLLADEPTSALDVTVQRLVLDQMQALTSDMGTAVLLITHDLALAAERADRIAVMYHGEIVETGSADRIVGDPRHEYTKRLLAAVPGISGAKTLLNRAGGSTPEQVPSPAEEPLTLLEVAGAVKTYRLRGRATTFRAVNDVHLVVPKGRTVAIVGESGSGKSTTAKLALRLERLDSGAVTFRGENVAKLAGERLLAFRRLVQPVFQNPYASLDPRYTVGRAIAEPLRVHRIGDSAHRKAAVAELLERVALPAAFAERYPHELSGGQRQRVAIARALALKPELVVMDEAVSALDVLVQRQILELMVSLQRDLGLSYLFISHDLAVVRQVSHYVYVMQAGRVVEAGTPEVIFGAPREEYTQRLIAAIPGRSVARDEPPHSPRFAAPRPD